MPIEIPNINEFVLNDIKSTVNNNNSNFLKISNANLELLKNVTEVIYPDCILYLGNKISICFIQSYLLKKNIEISSIERCMSQELSILKVTF